MAPRRTAPEWSYNDRSLPDTSRNDDDPYVDAVLTRVTLRVNSFGEDSSGLYTCHSRDTTVEYNLAWYDPSKLSIIVIITHLHTVHGSYNHNWCCTLDSYAVVYICISSALDRRPELIVEPKRQNVKIRDGDEKVTLECIAFDATITWERRSGEIPDKAILREGDSILELPNIRREDAGDYRCSAENRGGRSMSKYAKVTVTGEQLIVLHSASITKLLIKLLRHQRKSKS